MEWVMQIGSVVAFWGVSALFVLTPGADWAYSITAGLARRTVPAVLGLLAGHVLATAVVATGVGGLVAAFPAAMTVLTIAGSAYLVWLGVGNLRHPSVVHAGAAQAAGSRWRWGLRGFGVSGLNPKVFLLFLAILPQFVLPAGAVPTGVQILILGLVHVTSCAVVYLLVGYGAHTVLGSRPVAARAVGIASGIAMIGIGLFLIADKLLR